jgi:general L-amino acid transport system permease protein
MGVDGLMSGATLDPRLVHARAAPKRKLELNWSDPRFRSIVWQVVIIGVIALIVWYLAHNTSKNLEARHIATGFGFLDQSASIPIGESMLSFTSSVSTYGRALLIGVLNTLKLAVVGVVLATIVGTLAGIARLSPNWLLSRISGFYVETLRNIPVLLQLFFWAALLQTLPAPRQSFHPLPGVFLSNRGIKIPTIDWEVGHLWVLAAFVVGIVGTVLWSKAATRKQDQTGKRPLVWPVAVGALIVFPLVVWAVLQLPASLDMPVLHGFNFTGGLTVTPEYGAMLIGLVLYTATYIAGDAPHKGAAADRAAAGAARDRAADDQPVSQPDQEQLAGRGDRLRRDRVDRQHHAEPDRSGGGGHRHHHGGLSLLQRFDQPVHELVQRAHRAGGALSHVDHHRHRRPFGRAARPAPVGAGRSRRLGQGQSVRLDHLEHRQRHPDPADRADRMGPVRLGRAQRRVVGAAGRHRRGYLGLSGGAGHRRLLGAGTGEIPVHPVRLLSLR